MEDYGEYLNTTVLQENRPVTYNSLARSLKIHVDTAKQALYTFATANEKRVHAVYCVTGQMITTKQFTIQLVKSTNLEETKKLFRPLSGVHVYSVTSYDPIDFSVLYAACKDTPRLSLEERYTCGTLKNPNATYKTLEKSRAIQTNVNKPSPVAPKAHEPATKPTLFQPPKHKKGTLSFTPTKKPVTKPVTKEAPVEKKAVARGTKRKTNHDEAIEEKFAKATIKVEDIFSDEEEEEEEEEIKRSPEVEDDMEIDDIMDEASDVKEEKPEIEEQTPSPKASSPPPPPSSGKAKRKVLKKKTTMNARGHMVTEEVWEFEEIDEEEVKESKPLPKPACAKATPTTSKTTTKKAANTKKAPAQTNLFSFFNKK